MAKSAGRWLISNTAFTSAVSCQTRQTPWCNGSCRPKLFRRDRRCPRPGFRKLKRAMSRHISIRAERSLWFWRVARGQGLDVDRNGIPIALGQRCHVGHNAGHGRPHSTVVRCIARFQYFRDIAFCPIPNPPWRDVRDVSDAFRIQASGEAGFRFDGAENISGRMTFGAMPHCFGKILATIPGSITLRVRDDRLAIKEQDLPKADEAPDSEWQR